MPETFEAIQEFGQSAVGNPLKTAGTIGGFLTGHPFIAMALMETVGGILSLFASEPPKPPQSAHDKFIEEMTERWTNVRDTKNAAREIAAFVGGRSPSEFGLGSAGSTQIENVLGSIDLDRSEIGSGDVETKTNVRGREVSFVNSEGKRETIHLPIIDEGSQLDISSKKGDFTKPHPNLRELESKIESPSDVKSGKELGLPEATTTSQKIEQHRFLAGFEDDDDKLGRGGI